jgi:hypothetical protein
VNSAGAIFIKQFQDNIKNAGVLINYILFPVMAFIMTNVVDMGMPGMPESYFITMFAGMFVGMSLIGNAATAIAEDRSSNALRFLLMAGVRSHEYLMGIGGVIMACSLVVCGLFAADDARRFRCRNVGHAAFPDAGVNGFGADRRNHRYVI